MLEIVAHRDKLVIRRVRTTTFEGDVFEFWAGEGWSRAISEAKTFDSQDDAEDCRVVG